MSDADCQIQVSRPFLGAKVTLGSEPFVAIAVSGPCSGQKFRRALLLGQPLRSVA